MPIQFRSVLALLLLAVFSHSVAQLGHFTDQTFFKQYNTEAGLSQASVNAILRDSKGFMWFGTDDGLNRFDGNKFKIYRNKIDDSTSIVGNTVQALVEDPKGNVWVGTSEGVSCFNRHQEKFSRYMLERSEYYTCFDLQVDKDKKGVWVAAGPDGLCYIDFATGKLVRHTPEGHGITFLRLALVNGTLYAGTLEHGVLRIEQAGHEEPVALPRSNDPARTVFPIRCLRADNNALWVGTEGGGLHKVDLVTGRAQSFTSATRQLSDDKVWSVDIGADGRIWVGTDGGGLTILSANGTPEFHRHSDYNNRTISSNTIRDILIDPAGDAWLGTFNGGVCYYSSFSINFLTFRKDPEDENSLPFNAVLSFCESGGDLFVGTDGGGLSYLQSGKFSRYRFPSHVDEPNVILTLHRASNGALLIGTYQHGLYYITPDKTVIQYQFDETDSTSISSNIVWDIDEDRQGNFWLATELGINRFHPSRRGFTSYRNKARGDNADLFTVDYIQSILIDNDQNLWGGLYGVLVWYDLKNGVLKKFLAPEPNIPGVPNKQILSLREDRREKSMIWFASQGEGLMRFDAKANRFDLFSEKDGLPSNLIFAIESDTAGRVWLTTNKGLARFEPSSKKFHVFDESFGVDTDPFKDNASLMTRDGYLLFGGNQGFTAFLPAEIDFRQREFDITFTGFQMFNTEARIDGHILSRSITETDEVVLSVDQARFITFDISALQFLAPASIRYQYLLEGFDDTWHDVENKTVSFTNLDPREYRLHVRAGYMPGMWGDESVLVIRVVPAWWMTWQAKAGALLLAIALGYSFYRYRLYKLAKRKKELEHIVAVQNREIRHKNMELAAQNEELVQHNEELLMQRETISDQNKRLSDAQDQLREVNQSLESQVQQRTEKLNETITRLNKTIKELDAFLYSASHDLVSPLKSILGLVHLAKQESQDGNLDSYFVHIETTVRKLEGVIHTLMQHSFNTKADSRKQEADMCLLVRETIAEMQFMPEASRIKFNVDVECAVVLVDIPRMKIILSNLIGNAIKYHDPRKEHSVVDIRFTRSDNAWVLELHDNGIGIEKSRMSRIFDMFYRATESAKGSGLGLYIVKETVERLGGQIHVQSEYGLWTRFVMHFPVSA